MNGADFLVGVVSPAMMRPMGSLTLRRADSPTTARLGVSNSEFAIDIWLAVVARTDGSSNDGAVEVVLREADNP